MKEKGPDDCSTSCGIPFAEGPIERKRRKVPYSSEVESDDNLEGMWKGEWKMASE